MKSIEILLNKVNFPSSRELIELTVRDSAFANKTRHVSTASDVFQVRDNPFENSTWSFTSVENDFPSIKEACDNIARFTNKRVQCNAYYTPPNSNGLPVHYDLHDVLVVQIEGKKNWKIWPAFRKSVSLDTLLEDETKNIQVWTSRRPSQDFLLIHGKMLYLTKGEPHVAKTGLESSLHYSFGIYND